MFKDPITAITAILVTIIICLTVRSVQINAIAIQQGLVECPHGQNNNQTYWTTPEKCHR